MLPIYIARKIVLPQMDISGRIFGHSYVDYKIFLISIGQVLIE